MKLCSIVFVLLSFISSHFCFGQSDSVENWRKRYPDWTQTAQFLYSFYRWPELKLLKRTPEIDRIGVALSKKSAESNSNLCGPPEIYEVGRLNSKYFHSLFLLAYIISPDIMLGTGPPSTSMFAVTSDSLQAYSFDEPGKGQNSWPGELRHHVRFLESIGELGNLDSSAAIEAAIEVVAVLSADHPVMILDSLWDIYVFSNAVSDSSFWERLDDAGIDLLTQPVLRNFANDPHFRGHNVGEYLDRSEYDRMQDFLHPVVPPYAVRDGDELLVRLYSWSPCNCSLYRWLVSISKEGKLYVEKAQVSNDIGYCFTYF